MPSTRPGSGGDPAASGPAQAPAIPGGAQTPEGREPPDGDRNGPYRSTAGRIGAPDHRGPRRAAARDADDARHRGARDDALPPGQGARQLLRRVRPGGRVGRRDLGDGRRRTACASCTATSRRTSSAASSPRRIFAQYMGREDGITGGRDGNVHFGDRTKGCVGMVSMLPDMMLIATGHGDGVQAARRAALRDHLVRRRLDLARRLPRGDELGRRAEAAGDLHPREQPVRVLDAARPAVRGRPGRARRRLRLPGREGRRQRPRGDVRGRPPRARARARRRGPDADRGRDDAHARPRRARRHEVRADNEQVEEWQAQGPDRPPGQAPRGARGRRQALRDERQGRDRRRRRGGAESPMPDGDTATDRCSPTSRRCSRTATRPGPASGKEVR